MNKNSELDTSYARFFGFSRRVSSASSPIEIVSLETLSTIKENEKIESLSEEETKSSEVIEAAQESSSNENIESPQRHSNRQSSEGVGSKWDVKLDPTKMTIDCSCGIYLFRRRRNKK